MKKTKKYVLWMFLILCVVMIFPISANAAKLKKINVNKYAKLGKRYTVMAYNPKETWIKVYKKKSTKSKSYGMQLNYGGALTVAAGKLKKGVKTAWIPVYMYSGRTKTLGYVIASQVKLKALYTSRYSSNKVVDQAIKTGMKYLGTPFVMPGSSLDYGIDCAQFVNIIYRLAGKNLVSWAHTDQLQAACWEVFYHTSHTNLSSSELKKLKPGDLLFYRKYDTTGPIDHVAVYIGDGFILNSSGHYGSVYPNGGICIKRLQYGNRKIVRAMRIYGF